MLPIRMKIDIIAIPSSENSRLEKLKSKILSKIVNLLKDLNFEIIDFNMTSSINYSEEEE